MSVIQSALILIFPVAMAFAAATDLLTFKIPNRISIAIVVAFLIAAPLSGMSWSAVMMHLATFAVVLAIGIALYSTGHFGGGDAKLLAAASLWVGYDRLGMYVAMVALCGGVLALALLAFRRFELPAAIREQAWIARLHDPKGGMPYGIALAAAALWVYPSTKLFSGLMA